MSRNLFTEAAYSALDGRVDEKDYIDPSEKSRSLDLDFKGVTHDTITEGGIKSNAIFFVTNCVLRSKQANNPRYLQYHKTSSFDSMLCQNYQSSGFVFVCKLARSCFTL